MKKIFGILIFYSLNCYLFSQINPDILLMKEHAQLELKSYENVVNFKASKIEYGIDIYYCRFNWTVDPEAPYLKGKIDYYFISKADIQSVMLDFTDSLNIDSIIYHHNTLNWEHENNNIEIFLNITLPGGTFDSITIYYQGDPTKNERSFTQLFHKDIPIIATLSEPYGSKDWWPCIQDLNDKIDSIDIFVTVPSGYRVASNGLLVNETSNSLVTYHWKHRYPIAYYLIAIGITNYSVYREYVTLSNGVELEVLNYVYPEDADSLKNNTSQLLPVLQFFDEKYITYPFYKEKYGHAQFTWGGAMENQTMSFMGSFGFDILAHELSHQWFGNYITCATWQDIWLNEGFAKYSEALVHEHFSGNDYLNEWLIKYIDYVISEEDGSVWVEDTSDASRIFNYRLSYGKGALVLHMLRWEMGDSLFFTGINNYLNDPDLAFKTATTDDLKYHLENAADTSLTEFLDDWYYGQGFPKYKIYWYQDDEMKIYIKINQTTSHPSVDFFEMHIPIQLIGLGKDSNIILYNTYNDQEYLIETNFYVKDLAFDPNHKILTQTPTIINELIEKEKIHIFPNPFSDKIYIQKHQNIEINEIRIFDISGKMLVKTGYNEFIFTGNLSSGVYFIDIKSGNKIYKRKIVKY